MTTTKAIVLKAIKYGDTSLIIKCFTIDDGLKSYIARGILKSKKGKLKAAYFQPLNQLKITGSNKTNGTLNTIKEVQVINPYENIFKSITKQSIVIFLSEILANTIKEEEKNEQLYHYISTSLIWLDTSDKIANFHLVFLLNLTRFLGFYPNTTDKEFFNFSLSEGKFTQTALSKTTIEGEKLFLFKKILGITFDSIDTISLNQNERKIILKIITQYFELHLNGFQKPKSLDVLEAVFN